MAAQILPTGGPGNFTWAPLPTRAVLALACVCFAAYSSLLERQSKADKPKTFPSLPPVPQGLWAPLCMCLDFLLQSTPDVTGAGCLHVECLPPVPHACGLHMLTYSKLHRCKHICESQPKKTPKKLEAGQTWGGGSDYPGVGIPPPGPPKCEPGQETAKNTTQSTKRNTRKQSA